MKRYRRFVAVEGDDRIVSVIEKHKWLLALGSKSFIDWVKGNYHELKKDEEVPDAK